MKRILRSIGITCGVVFICLAGFIRSSYASFDCGQAFIEALTVDDVTDYMLLIGPLECCCFTNVVTPIPGTETLVSAGHCCDTVSVFCNTYTRTVFNSVHGQSTEDELNDLDVHGFPLVVSTVSEYEDQRVCECFLQATRICEVTQQYGDSYPMFSCHSCP